MEFNRDIYPQIYDIENLFLAFAKAKKGKTKRRYVKCFQKTLERILKN